MTEEEAAERRARETQREKQRKRQPNGPNPEIDALVVKLMRESRWQRAMGIDLTRDEWLQERRKQRESRCKLAATPKQIDM